MTGPAQNSKLESKKGSLIFSILLIFIVAIGAIMISSQAKDTALKKEVAEREKELSRGPLVRVAPVSKMSGDRTLSLIGETHPYATVTLYAKISGYLKEVKVDRGDLVRKDQILATIESPELVQEIVAAQADKQNKMSIAKRLSRLGARQLASTQEVQQAKAEAEIAKAKLESIMIRKTYTIIRAPFDGVVTARFADAGALMQNAANSQTSALPILTVLQVDRLRISVYVDQRDAHFIGPGSIVKITIPERPDISYDAKVTRMSAELDAKTRMLAAEIELDNRKREIVAGSFVKVSLKIHAPESIEIPVQALILQKDQPFAAVVNDAGILEYREIKILANDGKSVSVLSGLKVGEMLALNVGNSIVSGTHVQAVLPNKPEQGRTPASGTDVSQKGQNDKKSLK